MRGVRDRARRAYSGVGAGRLARGRGDCLRPRPLRLVRGRPRFCTSRRGGNGEANRLLCIAVHRCTLTFGCGPAKLAQYLPSRDGGLRQLQPARCAHEASWHARCSLALAVGARALISAEVAHPAARISALLTTTTEQGVIQQRRGTRRTVGAARTASKSSSNCVSMHERQNMTLHSRSHTSSCISVAGVPSGRCPASRAHRSSVGLAMRHRWHGRLNCATGYSSGGAPAQAGSARANEDAHYNSRTILAQVIVALILWLVPVTRGVPAGATVLWRARHMQARKLGLRGQWRCTGGCDIHSDGRAWGGKGRRQLHIQRQRSQGRRSRRGSVWHTARESVTRLPTSAT